MKRALTHEQRLEQMLWRRALTQCNRDHDKARAFVRGHLNMWRRLMEQPPQKDTAQRELPL